MINLDFKLSFFFCLFQRHHPLHQVSFQLDSLDLDCNDTRNSPGVTIATKDETSRGVAKACLQSVAGVGTILQVVDAKPRKPR